SLAATGVSVSHAYVSEGDFTITLTVNDGFQNVQSQIPIKIFAPASGGSGVINISQGKPPVENPLNGITMQVTSSEGGVVELAIDIEALIRDAFGVTTDFDGLLGRQATRSGT